MLPIVFGTKDERYDVKNYVLCSNPFGTNGIFHKATYLIKSERSIVYIEGSKIIISKKKDFVFLSLKKVNEYDEEIPQSHNVGQPAARGGRTTEQ